MSQSVIFWTADFWLERMDRIWCVNFTTTTYLLLLNHTLLFFFTRPSLFFWEDIRLGKNFWGREEVSRSAKLFLWGGFVDSLREFRNFDRNFLGTFIKLRLMRLITKNIFSVIGDVA